MKNYDVVIIGAGASGLSAGIFAKRSGLSTAIIERNVIGGQLNLFYEIFDYPGFDAINGTDLATKMHNQATKLGVETLYGDISKISFSPLNNLIVLDGEEIFAKSIILSMGARSLTLGIDGETDFLGKGICYNATSEGNIYKGQDVVVVGSGDTAIDDAMYLSNLCSKVTIINNLPKFASTDDKIKLLETQMEKSKNIDVVYNSAITKILGKVDVDGIEYVKDGKTIEKHCEALFVSVGRMPDTALVRNTVHLDENGYVAVDENYQTNIPGVFACGDIRSNLNFHQLVVACADGVMASNGVCKYLNKKA